jgi:hypothetical protein
MSSPACSRIGVAQSNSLERGGDELGVDSIRVDT